MLPKPLSCEGCPAQGVGQGYVPGKGPLDAEIAFVGQGPGEVEAGFNYGMTGGQVGPTTPRGALGTTAPYGNPELPFNLPSLMAACGANLLSRWTALHVRQVKEDILYSFQKPGFCFLEILAPCPVGFGKSNKINDGLEEMELYRQRSILVKNSAVSTDEMGIDLREQHPIYVGRFIDRDRPPYEPVKVDI